MTSNKGKGFQLYSSPVSGNINQSKLCNMHIITNKSIGNDQLMTRNLDTCGGTIETINMKHHSRHNYTIHQLINSQVTKQLNNHIPKHNLTNNLLNNNNNNNI